MAVDALYRKQRSSHGTEQPGFRGGEDEASTRSARPHVSDNCCRWTTVVILGIVSVLLHEVREYFTASYMLTDAFQNERNDSRLSGSASWGGNASHHGDDTLVVSNSLDGTPPAGRPGVRKNVVVKVNPGRAPSKNLVVSSVGSTSSAELSGLRKKETAKLVPEGTQSLTGKAQKVVIRVDPSKSVSASDPPSNTEAEDATKLRYLSLVYNEKIQNVSLFDDLEIIYRNSSAALPLQMIPCNVFVYGHECKRFWKRKCVTYGRHASGLDLTLIAERFLPTRKTIVGDGEWLEVTRWGMPEGNGYGCFFNVRTGTGVFVNVQKTIVVQDDKDAKRIFNATDTRGANYCPHARRLGYDSVQIVNAFDGQSNQFIFCRGSCETEKVEAACVPRLELRTGVHHDKPCDCDSAYPLLNCGNAISPKGSPHICDQEWGYAGLGSLLS